MTITTLDAGKNDVEKVTARITSHLGPPSEWWWPGGWPGDIEAALVDAVFSARAVYRSKHGRGICANVAAWRDGRGRAAWSLDELIAEIDSMGADAWARHFGNRQHSPARPPSAPGGPSKAAAVREAAGALREQGITTAADIGLGNTEAVQHVLASVPGIGRATASYFLMLLGAPGAKPDRIVHRFLSDAAGSGRARMMQPGQRVAAEHRQLRGLAPEGGRGGYVPVPEHHNDPVAAGVDLSEVDTAGHVPGIRPGPGIAQVQCAADQNAGHPVSRN